MAEQNRSPNSQLHVILHIRNNKQNGETMNHFCNPSNLYTYWNYTDEWLSILFPWLLKKSQGHNYSQRYLSHPSPTFQKSMEDTSWRKTRRGDQEKINRKGNKDNHRYQESLRRGEKCANNKTEKGVDGLLCQIFLLYQWTQDRAEQRYLFYCFPVICFYMTKPW